MNDNLYTTDFSSADSTPYELDGLSYEIKKMRKDFRKLSSQKSGKKKGEVKKLRRKVKDLKQECKALRLENEQLRAVLAQILESNPKLRQSAGWQNALITTLPKAFELATAAVNKLPAKPKSALYLPDSHSKK